MFVNFYRCIITTALTLGVQIGFLSVAQAQQIEPDLIEEFDEAPPAIEDNLPPDMALEDVINDTKQSDQAIDEEVYVPIISNKMRAFNHKRIELVELIEQHPNQVTIGGHSYPLNNADLVSTFYQSEQFPTIWTHENKLLSQVEAIKQVIQAATTDGLNPQIYHYSLISSLHSEQEYDDIIAYEVLLTDAYLSLAEHLANGLVDPTMTQPEWNAAKVSDIDLSRNLAQAYISQNYEQSLASFNNNNSRYLALKKQYNALINDKDNTEETPLPAVTLKAGMSHPGVSILRQKLGLKGHSDYFDETLTQAVKHFQRNIGISDDGIVGPGTRQLLNTTHQEVINDILINMERQRWLPQELGDPYILVNIPSYKVEMFQNNVEVYQTKSIVGRKARPTPAFTDRVRHIVMSPTWTVPPTIMRKDKLPKLRRNPAAFDGTFEAVSKSSGKILRPSAINWNSASASNYTLRQKPGRYNALGRIKFLFPNKYAIYLHDTPNKSMFNRANRAYSSGCVRIADPFDFAEKLLEGSNWSPEKIKAASSKSSERWVNPPHETPIYLVYWTVWADLSGHIKFAQDIYDLDNKLLKQYQQAMQ